MDNIGERIGELIEALGIKKVRFAERLKIDQSYVTQLTTGKRKPSDRTISDICREFNVQEEWLRNGSGKMFIDFTEDEFSKAAAALSNDMFVRSLIVEYWKLDEDNKQLFRNFIHKLSENMKEQEHSEKEKTVEELEEEYKKSRLNSASKTTSFASNTIEENTKRKNA
ncbi:MAG: helix-turn-helix transcriptional regulator [Lachnospiraceae bacterium]|nr:helix-turn-helix transcriptional regulator [Lachnospiraceae bacterium]